MLDKIIQSSFIDRIARTHGDPPADRDWAGELALRLEVLQPTIDQLQHAADGLVVTIKSKSFPPFSTCLMAIRDAVSKPAAQPARQASGITRETYFDECKKWLNRFGPGYVVINRTRDAAAWETWIAYYRQIGLASNASLMSQPRDEWTVPTQFPDTFDRQAPAPLADDEVAKIRRTGRYATRKPLADATSATTEHRYDTWERREEERKRRAEEAAKAFDRWAEEVASQPLPSASPELASRIAQRSAA